MNAQNSGTLVGRIAKLNPEANRFRFTLAVDPDFREQREDAHFFPLVAFGKLADTLKSLGVGDLVAVGYHLADTSYEKAGVRQFRWEVLADEVKFLAKKRPAAEPEAASAEPEIPPQAAPAADAKPPARSRRRSK